MVCYESYSVEYIRFTLVGTDRNPCLPILPRPLRCTLEDNSVSIIYSYMFIRINSEVKLVLSVYLCVLVSVNPCVCLLLRQLVSQLKSYLDETWHSFALSYLSFYLY